MGLVTAAVIGAAGAVYSAQSAKSNTSKQIQAQKDAQAAGKVDINALNDQTKAIATQNAIDSQNLEKQLTPEVAALRTQANAGILGQLGSTDPGVTKGQQILTNSLGQPLNTPLLNAAIAKAQSDLSMGGRLGMDQQGLATRQGAAQAGSVSGPGGGLGLGRDLTARDLGLTSYQVQQQRLQNASQLGGQELQLGQANQNNMLNSLNTLRQIHDTKFNQYLAAGEYTNNIKLPNIGLDPGSAANLAVGNANGASQSIVNQAAIAAQGQNAQTALYGQAAGYGLQAFNAYNNKTPPPATYTPPPSMSFNSTIPTYAPQTITSQ